MTAVLLPEPSSGDRLSFTFFIAAAVHAMVIFGLGFSIESGQKIAPTLNITLATHSDERAPEKADFLAQHNQQASGTIDIVKEITSRTQAEIADTNVRDVNPIAQQKASSKSQSNTQLLSTTRPQETRVLKQKNPEKTVNREEKQGQEVDTPLVNLELASLQAHLDKLKQAEAKKPRVRRLISVSTRAAHDAIYLNNWEEKIELIGNKNFPAEAVAKEIFGNLRLAVLINRTGGVENIEILQSSGHKLLDDAALQIVRLAAPFDRFPPEIRKTADQLEIIRTWRFEITGLRTSK
ncbi:energy transducer TonB [Teredinibacter franksiae]|uniref:energy transducer TonB n=1 Tax=Teredinibacter franksiae TaxID=2761453 RepID=UPI0016248FEB|nr:energy transducer TonB [Teredinibacter franksiae]